MAKQVQTARLEGSRWTPYLFVAPVAVYLLVFQGYPLLQELILSFTSTSLLSPSDHTFVGGRNYGDLVGTSDFHQVLLITAIYTVACVVLSIGLGLVAALLLNGPFRRTRCSASDGHHSMGGAASRGGADLHVDAERSVWNLQPRAARSWLRGRGGELAGQCVARLARDPDNNDLADLSFRVGCHSRGTARSVRRVA